MGKHVFFTKEQERWLRENYFSSQSYAALVEKFNDTFGTKRSADMLKDKCTKRLRLKGMPNPTQYGRKQKEQLPLGTIRRSQTGTYIKVRIASNADMSGYQEPYWTPLQKKIYQDAHGDIQPNQMVCFLNRDPEDFSVENLYPIDRKIAVIMSKNKWWSDDPELTLAAIKWCELFYTIKELNNDHRRSDTNS